MFLLCFQVREAGSSAALLRQSKYVTVLRKASDFLLQFKQVQWLLKPLTGLLVRLELMNFAAAFMTGSVFRFLNRLNCRSQHTHEFLVSGVNWDQIYSILCKTRLSKVRIKPLTSATQAKSKTKINILILSVKKKNVVRKKGDNSFLKKTKQENLVYHLDSCTIL